MSRFEKITREEENTKVGGNPKAYYFKSIHHVESRYPIIQNIFIF
jgi:hypothetical protein